MSDKKNKGWPRVATLGKKPDGKYYLVVDKDVTLKKGTFLYAEKPADKIDRLASAGHITEEEAEERKARVPKSVVMNFLLPDRE